jgi:hypothetical protein
MLLLMGWAYALWCHCRRLEQELRGERARADHVSRQLDGYEQQEAARRTIDDVLSNIPVPVGKRFPIRNHRRYWGYAYLMRMNSQYCKIGYARDVRERAAALQTGTPYKIETLHMIASHYAPRLEAYLQNRFAGKWITGEWFDLDRDDIAIICEISSPVTLADLDRIEGIED